MKKSSGIILAMLVISLCAFSQPPSGCRDAPLSTGFPVSILTGHYKGRYSLIVSDGPTVFTECIGNWDGRLPPGNYTIDTTGAIGSSMFGFKVNANGEVTSDWPASADARGNKLTLRTAKVTIDPGVYAKAGGYSVLAAYNAELTGPRSFWLVKGLAYRIGTWTNEGEVRFDVSYKGRVGSHTYSTVGEPHTLYYNTVDTEITALDNIPFTISSFKTMQPATKVTLPLITDVRVVITRQGAEICSLMPSRDDNQMVTCGCGNRFAITGKWWTVGQQPSPAASLTAQSSTLGVNGGPGQSRRNCTLDGPLPCQIER